MELTDSIILAFLKDQNRWNKVKAYCTRNSVTEMEALNTAARSIEKIDPYDTTLEINVVDAMYNWMEAN